MIGRCVGTVAFHNMWIARKAGVRGKQERALTEECSQMGVKRILSSQYHSFTFFIICFLGVIVLRISQPGVLRARAWRYWPRGPLC